MITMTTVYLLNAEKKNNVDFLIDCIAEYTLNHPEELEFAKQISAQLIHCKDNFTKEYRWKGYKE